MEIRKRQSWPEFHLDHDHDGLTTGQEQLHGSNPYDRDTDNDGVTDRQEVRQQSNPRLEQSSPVGTTLTSHEEARKRYYHYAERMLGWEDYQGLSWSTLKQDLQGSYHLGLAIDVGVQNTAKLAGETQLNRLYLLAQSPYVQYHKENGTLTTVEEVVDYQERVSQKAAEIDQFMARSAALAQNQPEKSIDHDSSAPDFEIGN